MARVASIVACSAMVMAATAVTTARAAPPDAPAAEAIFRAGRERAEAGDWANACSLFVQSNRLEFALGTSMNLAACEEHTGKLASAWELYRELLDVLPAHDDRRRFVAESVARLDLLVPRLTIVTDAAQVEGVAIARDGVDLGAVSLGAELPVDPGEHTILVSAPGRAARRYRVALTQGERSTVRVEPGEPLIQNAIASDTSSGNERRTAGWILGGVGVGALAVGTVLGIRALSERSASDGLCPMGVCRNQGALDDYESARSTALSADIVLGVGVASLAVGSYLLLASMNSARSSPAASLHGSPSGVGVSW